MGLPIELRFKLTEDDYLRGVRSHFLGHPFYWVAAAFLVVSIGAALICFSSDKPGPGGPTWTLVAGGLTVYLGYIFLVAPGRTYQRVSHALRDKVLYYRVTSTGLEVKSESFQARWDWNLFRYFTETKSCFLIYAIQGGSVQILLKRAMETPEVVRDVRDLLKAHLRPW